MLELGKETRVPLDGEIYVLAPFTVGMLEDWAAKLLEWEGDPFETAKAFVSHVGPELQKELLDEAKANKKELREQSMHIGSPLWDKWLHTPQGAMTFARLWLRQNHPDVSDLTALKVFAELGRDQLRLKQALKNAQGYIPPNSEAPETPGLTETSTLRVSGTTSIAG